MLTPAQIKNHQFSVSGRGTYAATEVDDYIQEIIESYEQMFKENGELVKKIGLLANRIEEYKEDENNIKEALLTAQRMADKVTKEANFAAESKLNDAKEKAEKAVSDATAEAEKIVSEAAAKAENIVGEAEQKAEKAKAEAELEVDKQRLSLEKSKQEVKDFKNEVMDMYKAHIEKLQQIPEQVDVELTAALAEKYAAPAVEKHEIEKETEQVESLGDYEADEPEQQDFEDIQSGDDSSDDDGETFNFNYDEIDDDDDVLEEEQENEDGFSVDFDTLGQEDDEEEAVSIPNELKYSSEIGGLFGNDDDDDDDDDNKPFGFFRKK